MDPGEVGYFQMTEFGLIIEPSAGYTAKLAARIEAMGFDMLLTPDTQNLSGDPYGQLSLAAANTRTLRVGTGVTNPVTRAAAVTASAMATLQLESGGRAICGLGRGDSSCAHIGRRQATTAEMRAYAEAVKTYIAGGEVLIDGKPSTMRWIEPGDVPAVPIDMAVTGPKTIRMAADVADRISFAVGSAPERIDWALATLHERLAETGRDPAEVAVGAYINLICDPDEARAIKLARTIAGLVAHFAGMKHAPVDHLPPQLKPLAIQLKTQYDMKHHNQESGSHLSLVDDEFTDWFTIAGPAQKCVDRLGALIEKGLQHVYILGGSDVAHPHGERITASVKQSENFAADVLPRFR
jgi:5,10-methylenetetrahydromethanopterin reductase